MQIFECDQGSDEWFEARLGIVTASCMSKILAKGEGKTRKRYRHELIAERITGIPTVGFSSVHTERGHEYESVVRDLYEQENSGYVHQVGFIRNHNDIGGVGYSPDALVGDHGLLEIKTLLPALMIDLILRDVIPSEHIKQIQCGLWVTGREWGDYAVYCPGFPIYSRRLTPDPEMFGVMRAGVEEFYCEMEKDMQELSRYATAVTPSWSGAECKGDASDMFA